MNIRFCDSIADIEAQQWNALLETDYPFIRHEFLSALEFAADSRDEGRFVACDELTGWQPQHIAVYKGNELVAAIPNYIKSHSYGEYIFDWAWANAYQRSGLNYYPKLLAAIPFSPVGGPRLLIAPQLNREETVAQIASAIQSRCQEQNLSSCHLLYLPQQDSDHFHDIGFAQRHSFQYHWNNLSSKGEMYRTFDDFLAELKSRKRKSIRKERTAIVDQDIEFELLEGAAIEDEHWTLFYEFYQRTYLKRSGHGGYFPAAFFRKLGETMPEQVLLVLAKQHGRYLAGALYLSSADTLYGRYWGCRAQADYLHFETCIYQGIDYCIRHGIQRFDAGAQGEHKLQRGFRPVSTWSNHWIRHPQFRAAIADFIKREQQQNIHYMQQAERYLPYRQ